MSLHRPSVDRHFQYSLVAAGPVLHTAIKCTELCTGVCLSGRGNIAGQAVSSTSSSSSSGTHVVVPYVNSQQQYQLSTSAAWDKKDRQVG